MAMNSGNITKAKYQADIKRKQAFFNRCQRRFKVAKTTGEKTFLKNEAKRICMELRQCSKNWKNFGFGGCAWVTKNFNMVNFTTGVKKTTGRPTASRKTTSSKASTRRTSARRTGTTRTSSRRTTNGSKVRSNSRTRSSAARRSYVAW
ncbi:MAG TPA: hypothetical protein P5081_13995 [Phycisphaerae bacterium]|nr:hypothetical protein [Phycisphaerae bacterium]HRW53983.1 hypothetical protein [Phycisphaerae bacterium]